MDSELLRKKCFAIESAAEGKLTVSQAADFLKFSASRIKTLKKMFRAGGPKALVNKKSRAAPHTVLLTTQQEN